MTDEEREQAERLASGYGSKDHEWHSCNGVSLHPIREKSFIAGYAAACEAKRKETEFLSRGLIGAEQLWLDRIEAERARSAKLLGALKAIATHSNQFFIRFGADKAIADYRARND